jgi:NitT/TauT family transport system ATP-binding protein
MQRSAVSIRNVSKAFQLRTGDELKVLDGISIDIRPGEFVSIVGASGCGKTTLLRILSGLEQASAGQIEIAYPTDVPAGRPKTATVFQGDALLPWRTVVRNIAFGLESDRTLARAQRHERASNLCKLVGLQRFEHAYPYEISGGMQQRVNIARALAVEPIVLLMDEPFAALDAQTREVMQRELLKIWERDRRTVIFVTHQMDEAIYLSDRVIVLRSRPGRIGRVLDVPFPRPRSLDLKRGPEFAELVAQVWQEIQSDVLGAETIDQI